jgi:hypothetical protein
MSNHTADSSANPLSFTQEFHAPWLEDCYDNVHVEPPAHDGLRLSFRPDLASLDRLRQLTEELSGKLNLISVTLKTQREENVDKLVLMNVVVDCLELQHKARHFYLESKLNVDYVVSNLLYILNHPNLLDLNKQQN